MNIFILSTQPIIAAQLQHDRHVVKMILESCQMLSTAIQLNDAYRELYDTMPGMRIVDRSLYKPTHANHPCNIWVRESAANFVWLTLHLNGLLDEYAHRFPGRAHKCNRLRYMFSGMAAKMTGLPHHRDSRRGAGFFTKLDGKHGINPAIENWAMENHTPFAVCVPDTFKQPTRPVVSYQAYYAFDKISQNHVAWTNRAIPQFLWDFAETRPEMQMRLELITAETRKRQERKRSAARAPSRTQTVRPTLTIATVANPDSVRNPFAASAA